MNYNEFRKLDLYDQDRIMLLYELYKIRKLEWLKENRYFNSIDYKKEEISIIELSLNEFLELGELKQCDDCQEWNLVDDLIDTEGLCNGGIGYVCPSCKENM